MTMRALLALLVMLITASVTWAAEPETSVPNVPVAAQTQTQSIVPEAIANSVAPILTYTPAFATPASKSQTKKASMGNPGPCYWSCDGCPWYCYISLGSCGQLVCN